MKTIYIVCIVILVVFVCDLHAKTIDILFYEQKLTFVIDDFVPKTKLNASEKGINKYYSEISVAGYKPLMDSLSAVKARLQLNDWLYYILIDETCKVMEKRNTNCQALKWFLLGKSGYKVKLSISKPHLLIWVESANNVFGLRKNKNTYCINCTDIKALDHFYLRFDPFKNNNRNFLFDFAVLPIFQNSKYIFKTFHLKKIDTLSRNVEVRFNSALISCLRDLPSLSMQQVFSVPLSRESYRVIDELSSSLNGLNDSVKVEMITAFTRMNSSYLTDQDNFGREKWMTPEEYLYYGSGDCEDRSSFLFYALCHILKKPLVIIDYPNAQHVNIGISLDLKSKPNFYYKNRPYYVCEPTVIHGLIHLGADDMTKKTKYEIIGEYTP